MQSIIVGVSLGFLIGLLLGYLLISAALKQTTVSLSRSLIQELQVAGLELRTTSIYSFADLIASSTTKPTEPAIQIQESGPTPLAGSSNSSAAARRTFTSSALIASDYSGCLKCGTKSSDQMTKNISEQAQTASNSAPDVPEPSAMPENTRQKPNRRTSRPG